MMSAGAGQGDLKVAYVDDDKDIRAIVKLSLALDPSMELRIFSSGDEVLDFLATGEWRPDVIMLDVMMPRMDGPTLLATIRARGGYDDTPIVFVTARAREADVRSYHEAGAAAVILKPFDPLTLAQRVRALAPSSPAS